MERISVCQVETKSVDNCNKSNSEVMKLRKCSSFDLVGKTDKNINYENKKLGECLIHTISGPCENCDDGDRKRKQDIEYQIAADILKQFHNVNELTCIPEESAIYTESDEDVDWKDDEMEYFHASLRTGNKSSRSIHTESKILRRNSSSYRRLCDLDNVQIGGKESDTSVSNLSLNDKLDDSRQDFRRHSRLGLYKILSDDLSINFTEGDEWGFSDLENEISCKNDYHSNNKARDMDCSGKMESKGRRHGIEEIHGFPQNTKQKSCRLLNPLPSPPSSLDDVNASLPRSTLLSYSGGNYHIHSNSLHEYYSGSLSENNENWGPYPAKHLLISTTSTISPPSVLDFGRAHVRK